jgi:hypothetical protein
MRAMARGEARRAHGFQSVVLLAVVALAGAAGCAGTGGGRMARLTPREKLYLVGLEIVGEDEALVPAAERGRVLPLRTIRGFPDPAVPHDPVGYLAVAVAGTSARDAEAILRAIEAWGPGETLVLTVRRNPYVADAGWWEADVKLRFPQRR